MRTTLVALTCLAIVAGLLLATWPPGPVRPVHEGILRDVQVTVGGSGTHGFVMIVFADGFVGIVPISSLQTRSWIVGSYYSLGGQSRTWPRGPRYWLVQKTPPVIERPIARPDSGPEE